MHTDLVLHNANAVTLQSISRRDLVCVIRQRLLLLDKEAAFGGLGVRRTGVGECLGMNLPE